MVRQLRYSNEDVMGFSKSRLPWQRQQRQYGRWWGRDKLEGKAHNYFNAAVYSGYFINFLWIKEKNFNIYPVESSGARKREGQRYNKCYWKHIKRNF
jgi:hypothetical protein